MGAPVLRILPYMVIFSKPVVPKVRLYIYWELLRSQREDCRKKKLLRTSEIESGNSTEEIKFLFVNPVHIHILLTFEKCKFTTAKKMLEIDIEIEIPGLRPKRLKVIVCIVIIIVLLLLFIGIAFYFGYFYGEMTSVTDVSTSSPTTSAPTIGTTSATDMSSSSPIMNSTEVSMPTTSMSTDSTPTTSTGYTPTNCDNSDCIVIPIESQIK